MKLETQLGSRLCQLMTQLTAVLLGSYYYFYYYYDYVLFVAGSVSVICIFLFFGTHFARLFAAVINTGSGLPCALLNHK